MPGLALTTSQCDFLMGAANAVLADVQACFRFGQSEYPISVGKPR